MRGGAAAAHLGCLLVGAVVAVAGLAVHRSVFPVGLLLAMVTSYATWWWLLTSARRRAAASYAVGWLVVLAVAVAGRREGDFVLAGDLAGYAFIVAGLGHVLLAAVALAGSRPRPT